MSTYEPTEILDVKGLPRPMSVVRTRGVVDKLEGDEILQVIVTDSGSMSDLKSWTDATDGVAMLDQGEAKEDSGAVFRHFIQKE